MTGTLKGAWDAYHGQDWVRAYERFTAARTEAELPVDGLAALADAAWWLGRTDETLAVSEQAYRLHLRDGRVPQAARLAMDIGFLCFLRGDSAIGSGWIGRARRLVRDRTDCVERGYLLSIEVDEALAAGDHETAVTRARQVQDIADLFRDPTLSALGLTGEATALIRQGDVRHGLRVLDEALLLVREGQVAPSYAGSVYCQMISACHDMGDVPRARQWTTATERWCAGFPSAVMFAGICRVHRVQLLCLEGRWGDAEREAGRACADLASMNVAAVAEAHYQVGEIRRMRDDRQAAEEAYRQAHQLGRDPQPGLALLRLAQGEVPAATAMVTAALTAAGADPLRRAPLLAALVDVALAAGDTVTAEAAGVELDEIATCFDSPGFTAAARRARGTVLAACGSPAAALPVLREACRRWQELDAPYEAARVRLQLAEVYASLGDRGGAALERDAAAAEFTRLGLAPYRRPAGTKPAGTKPAGTKPAVTKPAATKGASRAGPGASLTDREMEVLARVAAGASNRDIAATLVISEKTVARHLSNIFTKLAVSSRTEAAAYAFTHGLVRPPEPG